MQDVECPGCEATAERLTMLPKRRWLCKPCNLEFTDAQARTRDSYYLLSVPYDYRPDRV